MVPVYKHGSLQPGEVRQEDIRDNATDLHYTEVETKVRGLEDVTEVTQWHA